MPTCNFVKMLVDNILSKPAANETYSAVSLTASAVDGGASV